MQVLIYGNRKQDDELYDISTLEQKSAAFLAVFRILDEEWGVYDGLNSRHQQLYDRARAGDSNAAEKLLQSRKDYEYENIRIAEVRDARTSLRAMPRPD